MAPAERNRATTPLLVLLGLAVVALVVFGVRALTRDTMAVRVAPVSYQTLKSTISTNGKVEPVEEFQAHAPAAGVVQQIFVQVGQHVAPGTLLIRLDDADARARLASAQATLTSASNTLDDLVQGGSREERNRFSTELASAETERRQAAASLATVQILQAKGSASAGEVASAQARLDAAESALRNAHGRTAGRYSPGDRTAAESRVADARAALLASKASYAAANIRAPFAGTVYSIPVSAFDFVPAGDDLLDLADLNRIQVRAYFDEPEIGRLAAGQPVNIVWDAKPTMTWHGHIETAPTTVITYGTRSVGECIITVDDARGDLLPNTNVTVTVTEMQRPHVLSIPREALRTEGLANFVYRVVSGHLVRTAVEVGVVNLTSVEIIRGLTEGESIVLGPATPGRELSDGLAVKQVR